MKELGLTTSYETLQHFSRRDRNRNQARARSLKESVILCLSKRIRTVMISIPTLKLLEAQKDL